MSEVNKGELTPGDEVFISPRKEKELREECMREAFELIMADVDNGDLSREEAFESLDRIASEPGFALQVLAEATRSS